MHRFGGATAAQRGILAALLAALMWVGMLPLNPPEVAPHSAPPGDFSAERAMAHLEVLASSSRAVGTPGHAAARRYLREVVRGLGVETETQMVPSHVRFEGASGFSDNTGAIVVNAHYDSGTTGPGASDCGSCVVQLGNSHANCANGSVGHEPGVLSCPPQGHEGSRVGCVPYTCPSQAFRDFESI